MESIITMSSKGQFTLPVAARRAMKLEEGDKLLVKLDDNAAKIILSKPESIEEISQRLTSYIKPGTKPVMNVDEYYQKHRQPRT